MKFNPKGTNIEKFELNGDVYELNYDRLNQLRMDAAETFEKRLAHAGPMMRRHTSRCVPRSKKT